MPDEDRSLLADGIEETEEVVGQMHDVVVLDGRWAVGCAVAALVGGDDAKSLVGQGSELVTPRVPELGEAVAEHHQWPLAQFGDVHGDAIGGDRAMSDLVHEPRLYVEGGSIDGRFLLLRSNRGTDR